jgi:FdhD protein
MEPMSAVRRVRIHRLLAGAPAEEREDRLAVEEPLEIRIGGKPATVIMRTPGHDEELARGFLYTEGLIRRAEDLAGIARVESDKAEERGNVLDVTLAPSLVALRAKEKPFQRNFYASSSCGVCGKSSLEAIAVRSPKVVSDARFAPAVLVRLPERLREEQAAFEETGGLHAAALFDEVGTLVAVREDVGRHNAVDKLVGWALVAGRLPASRLALMVSGRASFEIVQKAIAAGVPAVCAVSAPSSLAVSLAERFGVSLVGFLRGPSMNVYSGGERIVD